MRFWILDPVTWDTQQEAQEYFNQDPNVGGVVIAWNDAGLVGYGFASVRTSFLNPTPGCRTKTFQISGINVRADGIGLY